MGAIGAEGCERSCCAYGIELSDPTSKASNADYHVFYLPI